VVVYIRTKNLNRSLANAAEPTQLALRSIKVATVGTLFLAVAASWLAVSLARLPIGWLTTPNRAFVMFVFVLSLVVPTIISTAACYSVASTDEGPARRFA
jgi:ABC-type spermidine/putrescine transport system permease subunit II